MKKILFLTSIALLTACAMGGYANNPDEYIVAFKKGGNAFVDSLKKTDTAEIRRKRAVVADDLAALASQCINGKVVRSRLQEGALSSRSDVLFKAAVEKTPAGRQVLSVKVRDLNNSVPGAPADGMYMLVAELEEGAGSTDIAFYYAPGAPYQNIVDAVKVWGNNGSAKCPDLS